MVAAAAPGLGELPLAQHTRLLAVLWLQLLGGAPRVATAAAEALAAVLATIRVAGARIVPPQRAASEPDVEEKETFELRRAQLSDDGEGIVMAAAAVAASPALETSGSARRRSRRQKSIGSGDEATPQRT